MRYKSKLVSGLLVVCLLISSLHIHRTSVAAAGVSKSKIHLSINSRNVSGKTVTIKKGKTKKLRVTAFKKKNAGITFRSNNRSVAAVSKTGKITAKKIGTAKITVIVKSKKKKRKGWLKLKVVAAKRKKDASLPTKKPDGAPTTETTTTPSEVPSVPTTSSPSESPAPNTGSVSDMYQITLRINGKDFSAKLYQTETTRNIMQKLPLSITMDELNGNEKFYYFSESFPTQTERVSSIHAGDLKLYGSSCLVLFYESFFTSYSYTSLGYVENPGDLAEVLGTGSVHVDVFSSE